MCFKIRTHANSFKWKDSSANHKTKISLIDNNNIRADTISIDLSTTVVEDTNKTESNKDIGNDGTPWETSDFAYPSDRNDKSTSDPDPVFALERWVTTWKGFSNQVNVLWNKHEIGSDKSHLRDDQEEKNSVASITTIESSSHITIRTPNMSLNSDKQLESNSTNDSENDNQNDW